MHDKWCITKKGSTRSGRTIILHAVVYVFHRHIHLYRFVFLYNNYYIRTIHLKYSHIFFITCTWSHIDYLNTLLQKLFFIVLWSVKTIWIFWLYTPWNRFVWQSFVLMIKVSIENAGYALYTASRDHSIRELFIAKSPKLEGCSRISDYTYFVFIKKRFY